MTARTLSIASVCLLLSASAAGAQVDRPSPVTDVMLDDPPAADWLHWRQSPEGWGYSPLDHITRDNVAELRLAWSWAMEPGSQETTPLVHDGVMFLASPGNVIHALDAATGDLIWEYRRQFAEGVRGRGITAHDADTGRELWRTSTIARPGEPGGDTWGDLPMIFRSGGDAGIAGSYDPELDLLYWGTSQAKPWARASRGTDGDALYTNSTLALDPETGDMRWFYQHVPGETHAVSRAAPE